MPRILVVDDEPEIVLIIKKFLSKFRYDIVTAAGGPQALAIVAAEPKFDLILLDVKMPGMNGIEVLAKLKEAGSTVPTLVLSGSIGAEKDLEALKGLGQSESDIVFKPVDLYELTQRIQNIVTPGGEGAPESRRD